MRSSVNAVLSFGLVSVPVGVAPLVTDKNLVTLRTLHRECMTPIKVQQTCVTCHTTSPLEADDLVKGFEYAKDHFVAVEDHELDAVKPDRSKIIRVNKFVDSYVIDPTRRNKSYVLLPNKVLSNPYAVLVNAMERTTTWGLGFATLWGKEHPCLLRDNGGLLILETLYTDDELLDVDVEPPHAESEQEIDLGVRFIEAWLAPIEKSDMVSASARTLQELVMSKVQGEDFQPPEEAEAPEPTPDVMDALRESIRQKEVV